MEDLSFFTLPITIALTVSGGTLGIVAWSMYSGRVRKSLKKGKFAKMEILSETRDAYGDSSRIPDIARRFSGRLSFTGLRRSFVHLAGDSFRDMRASIRFNGDVAVQYSKDGEKWALHGRREATNLSLRELVAEKTTMIEIEEDVFKRMNWSDEMNECVPLKDLDGKDDCPDIKGNYVFCHRDYVNHEELMGMMWKRGGIEGLLMKPSRAGVIVVDKDSKCVLTEKSKLFRVVPILITWEGKLEDESINWYTSSMMLGWEGFGKFFDKPAVSEKLRKAPWHISTPKDDATGDILCLNREDKGQLVFAKEECLSKGVKTE